MTDRPAAATDAPPQAIILAAGKGTRMATPSSAGGAIDESSVRPKVVYPVADRPMVCWVVDACREAGVERCIIVVGYKAEQVREALAGYDDCVYVEQREQLGTGHAARMAEPMFADEEPCDTFVLAGDGPLIRAATLRKLLEVHRQSRAASTLATAVIDDPTGYGRVVRSADGGLEAIVEHKDASEAQRAIREVNPSYYCFRSDLLFQTLAQVSNTNSQGEYYLTDVPSMLKRAGHVVSVVDAVPPEDVLSINTPAQLAEVDAILRKRLSQASRGAGSTGSRHVTTASSQGGGS